VLVGTTSVEKSELISGMLTEQGIKHQARPLLHEFGTLFCTLFAPHFRTLLSRPSELLCCCIRLLFVFRTLLSPNRNQPKPHPETQTRMKTKPYPKPHL
jgi:hypothetical protein